MDVDYHNDKLYVIYKGKFHLDILQVSGILIERIDLEEEFLMKKMKLLKLSMIKVPILNWSNRMMVKPEMS